MGFVIAVAVGGCLVALAPLLLELLLAPYRTLTLLLPLLSKGSPKVSASERLSIGELRNWAEKLSSALLAAPRRGMTTSRSRGDREVLGDAIWVVSDVNQFNVIMFNSGQCGSPGLL